MDFRFREQTIYHVRTEMRQSLVPKSPSFLSEGPLWKPPFSVTGRSISPRPLPHFQTLGGTYIPLSYISTLPASYPRGYLLFIYFI